jgi:HPt (histidine-containing phosphotransfer) domain-containing protein
MNSRNQELLFDLSYLNQVFQGNKELVDNIINLFLQQVPEYISEMVSCVERNDLLSLHPLAHKAKSSISMLGLKNMEKNVVRIEQDSKHNRNIEELPKIVYSVQDECVLVYEQLRGVLSPNAA